MLDLGEHQVISDVDYNSFVYDREPAARASSVLRAFLDVSNGHLSRNTQRWLDEQFRNRDLHVPREDAAATIPGGETYYGWFVYAPEDPMEGPLPDLERILRLARKQGAEYVRFDRDTPHNPRLPILGAEEPNNAAPPTL